MNITEKQRKQIIYFTKIMSQDIIKAMESCKPLQINFELDLVNGGISNLNTYEEKIKKSYQFKKKIKKGAK